MKAITKERVEELRASLDRWEFELSSVGEWDGQDPEDKASILYVLLGAKPSSGSADADEHLVRHFDKWVDCPGDDLDTMTRCPKCAAIRSRLASVLGIELNEKYCEMATKRIYGSLMK